MSHSHSVYDTAHNFEFVQNLCFYYQLSSKGSGRELCDYTSHGRWSRKRLGDKGTFFTRLRLATYYMISRVFAPQTPLANSTG